MKWVVLAMFFAGALAYAWAMRQQDEIRIEANWKRIEDALRSEDAGTTAGVSSWNR